LLRGAAALLLALVQRQAQPQRSSPTFWRAKPQSDETFGKHEHCLLDQFKPYQRSKLSDGEPVTDKGASTDVVEASAGAYLNAVNRFLSTENQK